MRMPEIREELLNIANDTRLPHEVKHRLRHLADETKRRSSRGLKPYNAVPITPELAREIRNYHVDHPWTSQAEIAKRFNVNQGRVSEILHGKRT